MNTDDLRRVYIDFFTSKGHTVFSSDSLVPQDATVLFTSAGMNQFKPYFLGEKKDIACAVSCQKCFRTGDLDEVGKTPFHHTFFEMLGNFSFGGYFKKEAISYAWEFLTGSLHLEAETLWVSVYHDDKEAYTIWRDTIGITPSKIVALGAKENFWPSNAPLDGPDGPCGPCSEIFYDRGKDCGCADPGCSPACGCGRFVEIWNLVFTQYNRVGENKLQPLPQKNIDTGMGLERMASVLQGKMSNFEIDILSPAVAHVRRLLKAEAEKDSPLVHAIVDHARAAAFAIGDGVFPSNEDRGYVVRKIIRKASWHAQFLGCHVPVLCDMVPLFGTLMQKPYPEIKRDAVKIASIIRVEEEKFLDMIKSARVQFQNIAIDLKAQGIDTVDSRTAFKLYDTYGLPLELTRELAREHTLKVDEEGLKDLFREQREASRKKSMFNDAIFTREEYAFDEQSRFTGYERAREDSCIVKILQKKKEKKSLHKDEEGTLVLDVTPFYPEAGGQSADTGQIRTEEGVFIVSDVQKVQDALVHIGRVKEGVINAGRCTAAIDTERRQALMRAHTATHLLQCALRAVLGGHVAQQGSYVEADRLRFDFTHFSGLTPSELKKTELLINQYILQADEVTKKELSFDEAKEKGALAFFKDKYGETVRMVDIGGYSKELCGGTHLHSTAEVGVCCIISESSIASGIRRIEAVTGREAVSRLFDYREYARAAAEMLNSREEELPEAVSRLQEEMKSSRQRIQHLKEELLSFKLDDVKRQRQSVEGIDVFVYRFKEAGASGLLHIVDLLRKASAEAFIFLASREAGKTVFVCAAADAIASRGISPQVFIQRYGKDAGLRGGGRGRIVQGIIKDDSTFETVRKLIVDFIKGQA